MFFSLIRVLTQVVINYILIITNLKSWKFKALVFLCYENIIRIFKAITLLSFLIIYNSKNYHGTYYAEDHEA